MRISEPTSGHLYQPPLQHPRRTIGRRSFDFSRQIAVMAIVNRTPDSFFDEGRTFALDAAVEAAMDAARAGADWVDIGGVKFAPGPELPADDEVARVLPVVQAVAQSSDVVISVDTFRHEVAEACIEAGAAVVNDTTGLHDPDVARVVADSDATLVITHSLARPRTPFPHPHYDDVVAEVTTFLRRRVDRAVELGVPIERIVIDPGHDLNKSTRQTLELTRRFAEIAEIGLPALAAVSNKDFIGETLDRDKPDRLAGSLAAATICAMQGARIVRMHAARESVDAMRLVEAVLGWREPAYERHNI
ncbi:MULTISPECIES: dihydropteroate synthase [unclassified Pseudoclavibacter]|uniref:dihydropteroate synthase n=1 Tax=unclassified Pseudoclavibacter TaxID=2615177 RepID=UPI001301003A|nr:MULTISPECIES: dihydropteroate synthase [unclassified Pseudoclavibacter]KAB1645836.1 dihydropteroate synthase [Pseudoclavibacter sp. CFCC 14310]KAB1664680.1 dihydropteroate synthase [Pseudoclavibacter sp. CFCC 13611]